jgi:hypothetical protein
MTGADLPPETRGWSGIFAASHQADTDEYDDHPGDNPRGDLLVERDLAVGRRFTAGSGQRRGGWGLA